ncbi:hypothetical protein LIA77_02234 [Sarocladium implicatum]|nr:hypothetical protein LIA77_02234 [Sarocladium implicatum]
MTLMQDKYLGCTVAQGLFDKISAPARPGSNMTACALSQEFFYDFGLDMDLAGILRAELANASRCPADFGVGVTGCRECALHASIPNTSMEPPALIMQHRVVTRK